jgi:DNA-binding winged helix-turn-helix (wHTH) protein
MMQARFGDLLFDTATRELTREGRPIALTPKAFDLLEALVESWPAALSKDALYDRLWPGLFVDQGNLHNLVSDIRIAIGDEAREVIRTIHRFGYALGVPVGRDSPAAVHLVIGARELPLHEGENIIGRDLVGTRDVSRRHARIVVDGMTATVEDLGSKNGTWIDKVRIKAPVSIQKDQEIVLGRTRAILRFTSASGSTMTAD